MAEVKKHHRLSMSQWSTLAVCPHFAPSREPSPEADDGTAAHREAQGIYEKVVAEHGEPKDAWRHEGKFPQAAWCASKYLERREAETPGAKAVCAVEARVCIQDTDPLVDGIYGYADFIRIERDEATRALVRILVADFKTFSDGTRNYDEQLAGYAVAIASTIPDAGDETPVDLVTLHGAVRRETVSHATLGECRRLAVDVMMKYLSRDRFPKVMNPKCRYCTHHPCAAAQAMLRAVQPNLGQLGISEEAMEAHPEDVPVTLAAIEEVARICEKVKALGVACIMRHGEKTETKDGLDKWELGDGLCRYEVRQSPGSRKIANVPEAVGALIQHGRSLLSMADLLGVCSMPVGKTEALLRKTLELSAADAEKMLADTGTVTRGAPTTTLKRIA